MKIRWIFLKSNNTRKRKSDLYSQFLHYPKSKRGENNTTNIFGEVLSVNHPYIHNPLAVLLHDPSRMTIVERC